MLETSPTTVSSALTKVAPRPSSAMEISLAISRNILHVNELFIVFIQVVTETAKMGFIGKINLLIIRGRSIAIECFFFNYVLPLIVD
jgi:hypothetical protein